MVGLAIASGCIEDVYPRNLAHIAIFVCPLRFAHFGPKFLEFGGFSWLLPMAMVGDHNNIDRHVYATPFEMSRNHHVH